MPTLTDRLRREYESLFGTCVIGLEQAAAVANIADKAVLNRARYMAVAAETGVPWYFIAAVHSLECGFRFTGHLHNGDPLSARTIHVPKGRPKNGSPPFTWEQSAQDALAMRGLSAQTDWSLPGLLYQLEAYNGWGYRNRGMPSPYLWSFSNHYSKGKYVADGKYDAAAVSQQCGAAVLLRELENRGAIALSSNGLDAAALELSIRGQVLFKQAYRAQGGEGRAAIDRVLPAICDCALVKVRKVLGG